VFVDGSNLLDKEARAHTSFLKDIAPLPGRNIGAGVRIFF
jgi:iron complex outermembrane receptor protein